MLLNNTTEAVEAAAAAAKGGFVHVPINIRLSSREVGEILRHSGARVLLIDREYAAITDGTGDCPALERCTTVAPDEAVSEYETWIMEQSPGEPDVDVSGDDNFISGTTESGYC